MLTDVDKYGNLNTEKGGILMGIVIKGFTFYQNANKELIGENTDGKIVVQINCPDILSEEDIIETVSCLDDLIFKEVENA